MVGLAAVGADTVAAVVVESMGHHREPIALAAGTGGHEEVVGGCMAEVVQLDTEPLKEVLLYRESFEPFLCQRQNR